MSAQRDNDTALDSQKSYTVGELRHIIAVVLTANPTSSQLDVFKPILSTLDVLPDSAVVHFETNLETRKIDILGGPWTERRG